MPQRKKKNCGFPQNFNFSGCIWLLWTELASLVVSILSKPIVSFFLPCRIVAHDVVCVRVCCELRVASSAFITSYIYQRTVQMLADLFKAVCVCVQFMFVWHLICEMCACECSSLLFTCKTVIVYMLPVWLTQFAIPFSWYVREEYLTTSMFRFI